MTGPRIRPARPEDAPLILDSWIRSFRESGIVRATGYGIEYQRGQRALVVELLGRETAETRVACHPEDEDTILGWACAEPGGGLLHYVYVKRGTDELPLRRQGLARALLDGWVIHSYTHRTSMCANLPIPVRWNFDPWKAWVAT